MDVKIQQFSIMSYSKSCWNFSLKAFVESCTSSSVEIWVGKYQQCDLIHWKIHFDQFPWAWVKVTFQVWLYCTVSSYRKYNVTLFCKMILQKCVDVNWT